MNGIVSQNMRNLGANYKINFGLTLPLLKKIAEEIPADAQLANALWNDTAVRESMMLAPMLYPADEFNEDEAEKWVTNMPNIEIADICCKSLFRRLRFAPRKALSWSLSDKMIRQYTGLQLATAWLIDHHEINDVSIFEQIADSALKKVADPNVNLAFPAINYLKQAVHHDKLSVYILSNSKNSFENNELYSNLFDELNQEKELFKEFSRYDSN